MASIDKKKEMVVHAIMGGNKPNESMKKTLVKGGFIVGDKWNKHYMMQLDIDGLQSVYMALNNI